MSVLKPKGCCCQKRACSSNTNKNRGEGHPCRDKRGQESSNPNQAEEG